MTDSTEKTNKCAAGSPLQQLEEPKQQTALLLGHAWVLSHDEKSISRSFHAKDWTTAMEFSQQVSVAAEAENHHPDVHLTNGVEVRLVLTTHTVGGLTQKDIDLAKKIDQIPVEYSLPWFREQQRIDMSEDAVKFDETHYPSGLNSFFTAPDAIEKFGGDGQGMFENAELRDIAAAKKELVEALRLQKGNVVADIGAGTGLLVPLLSEAVGPQGKVILSELSPLFRQHLAERCQHISNVVIVDNPTDRDPKLPPDGVVDVALMVDVYHHLEYPQAVLRNIRASLQRHGALVVVDFHRDPTRIKSHDADWVYHHLRADQATFTQEIERTGFTQVNQVDVPGLPENYFLVFRKRPLPLSEPGAGWTC